MSSNARRSMSDQPDRSTVYVAVGDLVRMGDNLHPHYQVVAVTDDRAWVRDIQFGADHVVPLNRCRRIGAGSA